MTAQPDIPTASRPTSRATVRAVCHDLMRALGLTTVFGNPGSTELPMLRDFPEDFRYVLGLQESVVVAMADGYAKGTGRATLVNLHTAAGLGNAMGAIITSWHGRTPLVITAGQQDRRQLEPEPFLSGPLVDIVRPYVKWSHQPARPEDVPSALERACHTALQAPQGPVFLSIPMDDWDAVVPRRLPRELSYRTAPDPGALDRVATRLAASDRLAIVAGSDAARAGATADLVRLAERLGADVWAEPYPAQAAFPQRHPLFQGFLPFAQAPLAEKLVGYDVVLVVGAAVFLYYPYVPGPVVPEGCEVIQLTPDPAEAARALEGFGVTGDVGLAVEGLLDRLGDPPPEAAGGPGAATDAGPAPKPAQPLPTAFVLHTLASHLPEGSILVEEAPSTKATWQEHVRIDASQSYHTTASGGLGYAMPAAVGLKLASPERPVVCVVGEGSAMYAVQTLWSAARYGAAVTFVVMDNGHYGILKMFGDLLELGDGLPGLDVPGLDLVRLAQGFGCEAERVERAEELPGALERALEGNRVHLLDIVVDPARGPLV